MSPHTFAGKMRSYTLKEKAKNKAGAVAALVIVAWLASSRWRCCPQDNQRGWRHTWNFVLLRTHQELCSPRRTYGYAGTWSQMNDNLSRADGARVLAVSSRTACDRRLQDRRSQADVFERISLAGVAGAAASRGRPYGRDRTASATSSAPARSPAEICWRDRISKARTRGLARWTARVIYALEAARVINRDPNINGAVEVASWCDEEGHFGKLSSAAAPMSAASPSRYRRGADRTAAGACVRRCATPVSPAAPARGANPGGISDISKPYRTGRDARKQRSQDWHRHVHRRGSGNTASFFTGEQNHAGTTRMAIRRDAASRSRDFASLSTSASPPPVAHARGGPPAASPSIPVRPASSRALRKCCSRFVDATTSGCDCAAGGSAAHHGCGDRQTGPLPPSRWSAFAPARLR